MDEGGERGARGRTQHALSRADEPLLAEQRLDLGGAPAERRVRCRLLDGKGELLLGREHHLVRIRAPARARARVEVRCERCEGEVLG